MNKKFPEWLTRPWPSGESFEETRRTVESLGLHTVCQSARCPNLGECWANRTATMMLLGNICTRNCAFCSVRSGAPAQLPEDEPANVAEAVRRMGLRHAVLTTVVRDDLPDGGAGHIAQTIRAIHAADSQTTVEILVSDFASDGRALRTVLDARPEVFCHNIETVRSQHTRLRDRRFSYDATLQCLRDAREHDSRHILKSALMVGHGETETEVEQCLHDLLDTGCEVVCIGQYLRPSGKQCEVAEFVHPDQFERYKRFALDAGFKFVLSAPFVRSSYRSEQVLGQDFARERLGLDPLAGVPA